MMKHTLAIKKVSSFKHTFITELANGSIGYIPNHAARIS